MPRPTPSPSLLSPVRQAWGLLAWLLLCAGVAALGARASVSAAGFYEALQRPDWAPPAGLFGPAWTLLYTLMAVAAWLVWRRGGWHVQRVPLTVFLAQLAMNGLWSWLFFAWQLGGPAFIDIALLIVAVLATILLFWRAQRLAGALLLPYLAWISFAAALNWNVWQANPQLLG